MYASSSDNPAIFPDDDIQSLKSSFARVFGEDDDSGDKIKSSKYLGMNTLPASVVLGEDDDSGDTKCLRVNTLPAELREETMAEVKKRPKSVVVVDGDNKNKTKKSIVRSSKEEMSSKGLRIKSGVAIKTLAEYMKFQPKVTKMINALLIQDILAVTSMDEVRVVISLKEKSGWLGSVYVKGDGEVVISLKEKSGWLGSVYVKGDGEELMAMKKALAEKGIHML